MLPSPMGVLTSDVIILVTPFRQRQARNVAIWDKLPALLEEFCAFSSEDQWHVTGTMKAGQSAMGLVATIRRRQRVGRAWPALGERRFRTDARTDG